MLFCEPIRQAIYALPSHVAFADCDEAPLPFKPIPSILVASSSKRHHGYWLLGSEIAPSRLAQINKALADKNAFDPGGWDITQVLRIPGSYNFKYSPAPRVEILHADLELIYEAEEMPRKKETVPLISHEVPEPFSEIDYQELLSNLYHRVDGRTKFLLRAPAAFTVDRSIWIWELEGRLARAGFDVGEVFEIVRRTPLARAKYGQRKDGNYRLWQEAIKAVTLS